ncbi:hypothetical protein GON01_02770 [Sphingomonas sp. MAH-20]|uniref:Uncharacterized protein n=1 Tax=Sphingomonas horti TaxID=2682842 RepID=A0A6I4IZL5_9SPHN|nr:MULTISPECIES: hypothetical protein [Sphingomonas]MBA2920875.1 hypothetical protein [Sphingomonas sp. CGMCC 1.13658]MVO76861.1 hypothetical protein [Sphingomonas horti]
MARTHMGFPTRRKTITVNGATRPLGAGRQFEIRVDGSTTSWVVEDGSHHEATYSAAISAMIDAHAAGVTHLTLQTPNDDVRRTATGEWTLKDCELARMRAIYLLFKCDFDDVDWIRGPA